MTATDEVRRMLDERGVEWFESITRKGLTWIRQDGKTVRFHPWQFNTLKVSMFDLTPEQAIEATLGRGTCHNIDASWPSLFECDECGYSNGDTYYGSERHFKFCPNCGRKVVDR